MLRLLILTVINVFLFLEGEKHRLSFSGCLISLDSEHIAEEETRVIWRMKVESVMGLPSATTCKPGSSSSCRKRKGQTVLSILFSLIIITIITC